MLDYNFNCTDLSKVKYSARRGILELDILLSRYLDNCYLNETKEDKKIFRKFLENEDNDIFIWLFKGIMPPAQFATLVKKIIR